MSIKPIVKWVGGKRGILEELKEKIPQSFDKENNAYYEPFVGGGALFFDLSPSHGGINDANRELINLYKVIRDDVDTFIEELSSYPYDKDFYYEIRGLDRREGYPGFLDPVRLAARTLYLNRTCFNGLYRVNKKGQFNTPFGRYSHPKICDDKALKNMSLYLHDNDISISSGDFSQSIKDAHKGDLVYLDPPYVPLSTTSSFASYTSSGFSGADQERIKEVVDSLSKEGVYVMISNSSCEEVFDLYSEYNIDTVKVARKVNSNSKNRGKIDEVIITNY